MIVTITGHPGLHLMGGRIGSMLSTVSESACDVSIIFDRTKPTEKIVMGCIFATKINDF